MTGGGIIERNSWPDVAAAVAARSRGESIPDAHAIDRYLWAPDAARPAMRALDCCCGVGQGALVLKSKGYTVEAFDCWPGAAPLLEREGIAFTETPFERFAPSASYNLICACECLEHLDDPASALERIRSWLAPDGEFLATVPIEAAVHGINPFHKHFWSEAEARELFRGWKNFDERWFNGFILALRLAPFVPPALPRGERMRPAIACRPKVSCICPTYGRATALGEALDSFLLQTYARRELVILNDAPVRITELPGLRKVARLDCGGGHWSAGPGVDVFVHNAGLFPNLGEKYTALLALATGDIIAHWEDDDLWFPNHLEVGVWRLLSAPHLDCVKNEAAWVLERNGRGGEGWRYAGWTGNVFESQMIFWRDAAREIGYAKSDKRQALYLLEEFGRRKVLDNRLFVPWITYVYRWDTSFRHGQLIDVQSCGGIDEWRASNRDWNPVLTRRACAPYLRLVLDGLDRSDVKERMSAADAAVVRGWLGRFLGAPVPTRAAAQGPRFGRRGARPQRSAV